jgi:hypothetical protein
MPGKGQLYKKSMPMKKMMQDPYAEGQSFKTIVPKPKPKPARPQTVNRAGKGSMMKRKMK